MANTILKFGKFKGQQLSSTPQWYQNWLNNQEWFNSQKNISYALLENGSIHTDDLSFEDANEMKERHARCFPNNSWAVVEMSATKGLEKLEGILQRHARISAKYA